MANTEEEYLADLIKDKTKKHKEYDFGDRTSFIADQTFDPVTRSMALVSGAKAQDSVVGQDTLAPAKAEMPTALPIAGLLLGGLGTLFKVSAEQAQGRAAKTAADLSAEFSERAAADAIERGNLREFEVTSRGEKILTDQLSAQAGTKSDVNVGGQLTTRQASRGNLDFDRALVRRNATMEAYGLRARAQAQRQEGEYAQEAADNAATGTFLSGIAKFIGGTGELLIDNPEILAGA